MFEPGAIKTFTDYHNFIRETFKVQYYADFFVRTSSDRLIDHFKHALTIHNVSYLLIYTEEDMNKAERIYSAQIYENSLFINLNEHAVPSSLLHWVRILI